MTHTTYNLFEIVKIELNQISTANGIFYFFIEKREHVCIVANDELKESEIGRTFSQFAQFKNS